MGAMNSLPPGFRFHPTDEELVAYYLQRKLTGRSIELDIIPEVDLYKCEPWDLPDKSLLASKDMEWYFFSPRDRKYPNGSRTNRATRGGYWKATGKDRNIHVSNNVMNSSSSSSSSPENKKETLVGTKKTLVFYRGRAPHGIRTNWVMHEYRLLHHSTPSSFSSLKDSYSLCRVFKKTIQIPEMPKEEDQKKGSIMRMSSEEKLVIEEDNDHQKVVINHHHHHDHYCTSNNKLVIPNGDASSSDLTQGTPTHQTGFIDDFQPQFASDEANSNNNNAINHSYSLGIDYYPSNLFQDVVGMYGGMHDEIPAYSAFEMEDFPQINIAETKAMKHEMSGHCILYEKYKDCMNGTLEEIIALCSSDHQDIYNN